jgi:hypothetical protein
MTIVLQWLVEQAWVVYAACAIGVLIYVVRALTAQRERSLALFTLEREAAATSAVRSWVMAFVFVAIGAIVFVATVIVLPNLSGRDVATLSLTSTPAAGVERPTPTVTPAPSSTPVLTTSVTTVETAPTPIPAEPAAEPTEVPTPLPTDTPPAVALDQAVGARFGDFAELASYNLPSTQFSTAQAVPLTLYWRGLAGASPVDYVVFTHLLAEDGHLIAQHDGPPAGGTRPTGTWVNGEIIEDFHPLAFQDTGYTGSARIAVGLYDPSTGRVLTQGGGDRVVLPVVISVVP